MPDSLTLPDSLTSDWRELVRSAVRYLDGKPFDRVFVARHARSGLWAATDPELNRAAYDDPAWRFRIVVTRWENGVWRPASPVQVTRHTRTPRSFAPWRWTDGYGWQLEPEMVECSAAFNDLLRGNGRESYIFRDERGAWRPSWLILSDGVPR